MNIYDQAADKAFAAYELEVEAFHLTKPWHFLNRRRHRNRALVLLDTHYALRKKALEWTRAHSSPISPSPSRRPSLT